MATTLTQVAGGHGTTCATATVQIDPGAQAPARDDAQLDTPAPQSGGAHWNEHDPPQWSSGWKHPQSDEPSLWSAVQTPPPGQSPPHVGNGCDPHGTIARQTPSAVGILALKSVAPEFFIVLSGPKRSE